MCRASTAFIGQDVGVAQPTQLNATEQDTLVKQIGLSLLRAAPRDWRRVTVEYRAVGKYHELTGEVALADGTTQEWTATHDIASLFGRLRTGMYREGRGTWFNARYQLDHPSSYNLEYDREEPNWDLAPPPQAYADELRMFPRTEENVPDWLMRRMAGLGPERPGPRFRMARVFDGVGAGGHPVVNRPELDVEEQDKLLDYLDGAPVVVPGRGLDLDRLANPPESAVPIAFHSDGTWIWPAAVNYYLRKYGVAPEPELVQHIRANGFTIPDVPDAVRQAAAAHVSRGGPPPPLPQRPVPPAPGQERAPEQPEPTPPAPVEHAQEPQRPYEEEPPESDAERTRLAAPVSAPPQDYEPERRGEPHDAQHFEESDAERTRIAAPPQFAEDERHAEDARYDEQEYAEEPYEEDYRDERYEGDRYERQDQEGYEHRPYRDEAYEHREYEERGYEDDRSDGPPHSEHPADAATTYTPVAALHDGPPTTITPPPQPATAPPTPEGPDRGQSPDRRPEPAEQPEPARAQDGRDDGHDDGGPPTEYSPGPLVYDEPVLEDLQDRLDELGVPEWSYRIGEPAEQGWALEEVGEGWRVGRYDDKQLTSPAVFGDVEDAAAFMLGKLLLTSEHDTTRPQGSPVPPPQTGDLPQRQLPPQQERPVPPQHVTATLSSDVATGTRPPTPPEPMGEQRVPSPHEEQGVHSPQPPQGGSAPVPPPPPRRDVPRPAEPATQSRNGQAGKGSQQWPIQPLPGEPPLTLFRGKEMRDLPVGSELDRFGSPSGNLTYAAGTPFEERSLVPEWVNRPYHVYRVQRPLRVLAGVAIPWFNQPGGGAAYLLPASIEELLAEGDLIELEPGEPPID